MRPVSQTPTEPRHYAGISAAYLAGLTALAASPAARRNAGRMTAAELVPLGAATFALAKTVSKEKAETWVRQPFLEETPDGERRPRGRGMRYAIGELLSCPRCLGAWSALGLVGLRTTAPAAGQVATAVLAASAANDFLQAGFTWLCAQSNATEAEAEVREADAERLEAVPGPRGAVG